MTHQYRCIVCPYQWCYQNPLSIPCNFEQGTLFSSDVSLCIGMVTELAYRGIPDAKIQEIERWKASAFKSYIRQQQISYHFSPPPLDDTLEVHLKHPSQHTLSFLLFTSTFCKLSCQRFSELYIEIVWFSIPYLAEIAVNDRVGGPI